MGLGVGERERRAPGAAEHQPALDAEVLAQLLDVGDQVPGRVVLEARVRPAAAAAALVEQDDAIARGIEEPARARVAAGAGAAVQEDRRLAVGIAAFLPVDLVAVADDQMPLAARLDGRIESASRTAVVQKDILLRRLIQVIPVPGAVVYKISW